MRTNFEKERQRMVEEQLITRGLTNKKVLEAMLKIPREEFVPENLVNRAYEDCPLPIGEGQTISQPYMVALMVEKLALTGEEKVLEVGAGSGYEAAVLACLCKKVYTIERISGLVSFATENLARLGLDNIIIKEGDGYLGLQEFFPYQGIIVACAISRTPKALIEQLDEGGRLVIPLGGRFSQELTVIIKKEGRIESERVCGCVFVPLITGDS